MKFTSVLLLLLLVKFGFSQETTCAVKIADSTAFQELEAQIALGLNLKPAGEPSCNLLRVVVHVVYDGSKTGYYRGEITPEQVLSQIRVTNQFLRNDSLMQHDQNTALGYEIVLADTDPYGNPTTGIIYHDGAALFGPSWSMYGLQNENPAAISATTLSETVGWDADLNGKKYINTYIVSSMDGNTGGGVQAYAFMPTPNFVYGSYNLFNTFGASQLQEEYGQYFDLKSFTSLGLTFTHELLHNLALFHTFHGNSCEPEYNPELQGDRVADTPPQTQGIGCTGSCGFLSYNVMDYISQTCKNRITPGQVARVHLAINNSLQDYLVCDTGCNPGNGDFNGDGSVNLVDISMLSIHFGSVSSDPAYDSTFDMNCDGMINLIDLATLQINMFD